MRRLLFLALLTALPASAGAQSSQFGARGLGLPGRGLSVGSLGAGGAFGLFDPSSGLNPGALGGLPVLTAVFTTAADFRHVEDPAGSANVRSTRFPHAILGGPLRTLPLSIGGGVSAYADRDFTFASVDTISPRGVPVEVFDSLTSRGGLTDLHFDAAYRLGNGALGASFHVITGSTRMLLRRRFSDTLFVPSTERAELSYSGVGVSVGIVRMVGPRLAVAAFARTDGTVDIERDSTPASEIDLPYSFGLGLRWRPSARLSLATQGLYRTWSGANSDLLAGGTAGADNTFELAVGAEYANDPRRPAHRPIRVGARYGSLPFLLTPEHQPKELGLSLGTGFRFAQERAGIDLSLERVWRWDGAGRKERTFLVAIGVTVRPYGEGR